MTTANHMVDNLPDKDIEKEKNMNEYAHLLTQFGLSDKESAIYVALLELGHADVSSIAQKAGVKRPTAYFVIDDLLRKGFISTAAGAVKQFAAENPEKILALERGKISQLEKALPGLVGLSSKSTSKPFVRFFSGIDGVKAVYEESLLQEAGSEMLSWGNAKAVEEGISDFADWYIKRRVENGISLRAIVTDTPYHRAIVARDKDELRQTKLLSKELFTQDVEINVYADKVAMISFVEGEMIGVIIQSRVFTAGHRQMFELLWGIAQDQK